MMDRREWGHFNQAICLGSSLGCIPRDFKLIRYSVQTLTQLPLEIVYRAACFLSSLAKCWRSAVLVLVGRHRYEYVFSGSVSVYFGALCYPVHHDSAICLSLSLSCHLSWPGWVHVPLRFARDILFCTFSASNQWVLFAVAELVQVWHLIHAREFPQERSLHHI